MREAVFGALEAANTAFGLAPFAFDRLPRLLADLPSALPPGGDPDLLDPCLLEAGGHSRQTGPPIVDQQLGSGWAPNTWRYACKAASGILFSSARAATRSPNR